VVVQVVVADISHLQQAEQVVLQLAVKVMQVAHLILVLVYLAQVAVVQVQQVMLLE